MASPKFTRQSAAAREQDLIDATLHCVADLGVHRLTVREVARRAGVTPGLIRRYFVSKDRMVQAAYRHFITDMANYAGQKVAGLAPARRFTQLVATSLSPPLATPHTLAIWANFIGLVNTDPAMAHIHEEGYRAYRQLFEDCLGELYRKQGLHVHQATLRQQAITLNAIIDGFWLEISMASDAMTGQDILPLAQRACAAVVGPAAANILSETE